METGPENEFTYRGARALVLLHEREMRRFLETWEEAAAVGLAMPPTEDPDCRTLEALLRHVLLAAMGYMVWICRQLELPDPEIPPRPADLSTRAARTAWADHLLECWRPPLREVGFDRFEDREYPSPWKVRYCIDAMLEHAVMHPLRHRFQLEELLAARHERVQGEGRLIEPLSEPLGG